MRHISRQFRRDQTGATAVEFAILMPIMMVCFGAIVEGARIYWNYQGAVSGVRDAARYIARIEDPEICVGRPTGLLPEGSLIANAIATDRIEASMGTGDANLFPLGVSIVDGSVSTRLRCVATPGHVQPVTPVAVVAVQVQVDLPFGAVFEFFGTRENSEMRSIITDQARIYGI
ncbi:MAG: TadE/TadG family type IV pilus assembly protein [Pseudomonadota bacterium]